MPIIYIAGPYTADTEYGVHQNIQVAEKWGAWVIKRGGFVYIPHKNSAYMGGLKPDQFWYDMGLAFVRLCDAVLVVPGFTRSKGTHKEIQEAIARHKKIFFAEYEQDLKELEKRLTAGGWKLEK